MYARIGIHLKEQVILQYILSNTIQQICIWKFNLTELQIHKQLYCFILYCKHLFGKPFD